MCGIAGAIGHRDAAQLVRAMSDALVHRGPDGAGVWVEDDGSVALGHRRLAIIDLTDRASQPMCSADGRFVLVYNGEVYNFRELRRELELDFGVHFTSDSDTEVVLNGFIVWGTSVVRRLNGMFAFAVWDRREKKVFLARDRLGVKPLYWARVGEAVLFASELGALLACGEVSKEISQSALCEFLSVGYVTSPRTLLGAVGKLPPATTMTVDCRAEVCIQGYWSVLDTFNAPVVNRTMHDALEELEALLSDAFTKRMISDVPVGIYLSGGVDSSLLATLLVRNGARPRAFTLAVEHEGFDESLQAAETARVLGIEHTIERMSLEDVKQQIACLPTAYDEPLADTSALPTLAISKAAARHVKVVLSADGGDELFGGYRRYQWSASLERVLRVVPRNRLREAVRFSRRSMGSGSGPVRIFGSRAWKVARNLERLEDVLTNDDALSRYMQWNAIGGAGVMTLLFPGFDGHAHRAVAELGLPLGRDLLSECMILDVLTYLPDDILMKVDRATMAASMEGRDPFLDHRIVEFSARLPVEYKMRGGRGKLILKALLERHGLRGPAQTKKRGFSLPITDWLTRDWDALLSEYVNRDTLRDLPGLDVDAAMMLRSRFRAGERALAGLMYALLCLSMWRAAWRV